ncbi:MAG TPA: hypothetical protein VN944_01190 [Nitrospiria bacterium]|nr:hypothetical protein [Nitrospiria bacterium]
MKYVIKKLSMLFASGCVVFVFGCGDIGNPNANSNNGSGGTNMATIVLSWDTPTTNMNGTSLTNLVGYKVFTGTSPGKLTLLADVGNTNTYTVSGVPSTSTVYFSVTAYDTLGNESDLSNLVSG